MKIDKDKMDLICDYISDKNFSFFSENMVGKTQTQLYCVSRYAYENDNKHIVILINNRNSIHTVFDILRDLNDESEESKLLALHNSINVIRVANTKILIVHNIIYLMQAINNSPIDVLMIDDFSNIQKDEEDIKIISEQVKLKNIQLFVNGSLNNEQTYNHISILKEHNDFKDITLEFLDDIAVYLRMYKIINIKRKKVDN